MTRHTVATRAFLASLLVAAILTPGPASSAGPQSDDDFSYDNSRYDKAATLAVEGTLVTIADTVRGSDENAYAVTTAQGDSIAVPQSFGDKAPTGGHFEGELAVTGDLVSDIRAEGVTVDQGKSIEVDSAAGQVALQVIAEQEVQLPVASATVSEPVAAAATPGAHHAYVAVISNRGDLPTDDQIQDRVDEITSYWDDQAGDAIMSFDTVQSVQYASSAASVSSCGLTDGNWNAVWTEARAHFPGTEFTTPGSRNHLIVMIPESCNPNGSVGIGTVGDSIADGGTSIVELRPGAVQIGAHELGHNFGLGHANLERCTTSCAVEAYSDAYSVMGFSIDGYMPAALDSAYRRFLDVDQPNEIDDIESDGVTSVELEPRSDASGLRALRIVDPVTSMEYFVEYRSGTGVDASTFYAGTANLRDSPYRFDPGIVITQQYTSPEDNGRLTKVLTHSSGTLYNAYLTTDESFASPGGGVQIDVGDLSGASAKVKVNLPTDHVSPAGVPTLSTLAPRVGESVTAAPGLWDTTDLSYQWRLDGGAIPGATGPAYTPPGGYYAHSLSVSVTGSRHGFLSTTQTSAPATINAGTLNWSTPVITGKRKVGKRLTVVPGAWTPGTTLTYRWYANGKAISKATKSTYKITKSKRKKKLTVRVTGSQHGFNTAIVGSARTAKIK